MSTRRETLALAYLSCLSYSYSSASLSSPLSSSSAGGRNPSACVSMISCMYASECEAEKSDVNSVRQFVCARKCLSTQLDECQSFSWSLHEEV